MYRFRCFLLVCASIILLTLCPPSGVCAAEYQWSVPVEPHSSQPGTPRAFLWIPPQCARVQAVVIGQHNMLEESIFDSSVFRSTMAELGFAVVWVSPSFDMVYRFDHGAGERFDSMMKALAQESGYQELETVPVVPIGHSAHASYPWNFAAWNPGRTLAVLSVKGDAPLTNLTGSGKPNPGWGERNTDGVPALMVMGEYEWMPERLAPAIAYRKLHPGVPISVLCDSGHGHFDASEKLIRFLCLFLRKAVHYRLPSVAAAGTSLEPAKLRLIDPRQGWLVQTWVKDKARTVPAAPFAQYKGAAEEAFWSFDEETALANEQYAVQLGAQPQLLGVEQDGKPIPQVPNTHFQVMAKFLPMPAPLDDGISFAAKGVFIDTVPEGNPSRWSGLPSGSSIRHATGGGPVMMSRINGPVVQTGPDTWQLCFHRGLDIANPALTKADIWLLASHQGDAEFKSAVQQALVTMPLRNRDGGEQRITFPEFAARITNTTPLLKLAATSDSGLPVRYYVREGPAEIVGDGNGNTLKFTAIPPRARYPVSVTIVAWQYGRSTGNKVQTAEPVVRVLQIEKGTQ